MCFGIKKSLKNLNANLVVKGNRKLLFALYLEITSRKCQESLSIRCLPVLKSPLKRPFTFFRVLTVRSNVQLTNWSDP